MKKLDKIRLNSCELTELAKVILTMLSKEAFSDKLLTLKKLL
jgi:hypothetical protein